MAAASSRLIDLLGVAVETFLIFCAQRESRQTDRQTDSLGSNGVQGVTEKSRATLTHRRTPVQPSAKVGWDSGGTSWRKGRASSRKKTKVQVIRSPSQKNGAPPSHQLRTRCTWELLQSDSLSGLTNHGYTALTSIRLERET